MARLPVAVVRSPAVRVQVLLTHWQTEPLALVALAVTVAFGAAYLVAIRRLQARGRGWSRWRTASFLGGLAIIVVAVDSGVAAYDDSVFTVHVVQHLLLMSMAPPLLGLGASLTLALQTTARPVKTRILKVLHSPPLQLLANPGVAVALGLGTMYAYFLTGIYPFSVHHPLFHDYTHLHFLVVGCLYWWPILSVDPMPRRLGFGARMGMLAVTVPFNAFLGIAIMNMSRPIASVHTLADTHAGGALLWGFSELFTLAALAVVFTQWSRAEERKAARDDRLVAPAGGRGWTGPMPGAGPVPSRSPTPPAGQGSPPG
ncbi:MAG: cytochrome c oxidase assembly protein [Acidimicrobiales bacterium]